MLVNPRFVRKQWPLVGNRMCSLCHVSDIPLQCQHSPCVFVWFGLQGVDVLGNDLCSMRRERQSEQSKGCARPPNYFPQLLVEQTYFSGCSSMWAQALFIQDDTLHIHSSTSRQTSTDLGSLHGSPEKEKRKHKERQVWMEWWNVVDFSFLGAILICVPLGQWSQLMPS